MSEVISSFRSLRAGSQVFAERIGFGLYQSSGDRGSVGHVSVFWLRWCGWCRWRVGWGLGQGSGAVGWCYVCVRCESGFSV